MTPNRDWLPWLLGEDYSTCIYVVSLSHVMTWVLWLVGVVGGRGQFVSIYVIHLYVVLLNQSMNAIIIGHVLQPLYIRTKVAGTIIVFADFHKSAKLNCFLLVNILISTLEDNTRIPRPLKMDLQVSILYVCLPEAIFT